jgi:type II secretory ATPase GspE/PulE/Tfp pilus assembly ATPase PilB-like protein
MAKASQAYVVRCWNCLNDFEAIEAVWCNCDPRKPSKLCPFCLQCFCPSDEDYQRNFWSLAPDSLKEEVAILERSQDRLGEILIRNQKLTTPELLRALVEQKRTGDLLGKILVQKGWVSQSDIDDALRYQGYKPLVDMDGAEVPATPVADQSGPPETLNYLLTLGAKKGASDIHIEPTGEDLAVKFRIDGYFYKLKPLPRTALEPLAAKIGSLFRLDPTREGVPQKGRAVTQLMEREYDLLAQTLPTQKGTSTTIKLVDRRFFLKNFTALGLTPANQLFLVRALDATAGLILVSSPPFNGAMTTCYSLMDHLAKSERKVVSLEPSIQWQVPYVNQIEVSEERGFGFQEALRSLTTVKPDVLFALDLSDRATATRVCQLASSVLVVATLPAFSSVEALWRLYEHGVPPSLISRSLSLVLNQRLVRRVCTDCREGGNPADPQKLALHGINAEEAAGLRLYRGKGCSTCNRIGYRRRKGIFEIMIIDDDMKELLAKRPALPDIEAAARTSGMETLRERCLHDVTDGITSIDEFIRWRL